MRAYVIVGITKTIKTYVWDFFSLMFNGIKQLVYSFTCLLVNFNFNFLSDYFVVLRKKTTFAEK